MSESQDFGPRPAWMEDELVREIPRRKLDFLGQLFEQGQGLNQKEMMALMLPMLRRAKAEHLNFTAQEMNAAIAAIRKHSSSEELSRIDQILAKAGPQSGAKQGGPS